MVQLETLYKYHDMCLTLIPLNSKTKEPYEKYANYKTVPQGRDALKVLFRSYPDADWAVYCINGVVGFDFDSPKTYEVYFNNIDTLTTKSPSGGYHMFIKSLAPLKSFEVMGLEIKVNLLNTLIGDGYEIIKDCSLKELEDAEGFIKKTLPKMKTYNTKTNKQLKDLKISDVVLEYAEKKESGHNYWRAFCPIHGDIETPHLYIYEETNSWYCFKCNKGGLPGHFIADVEGIKLKEVPKLLKDKFDIDISTEDEEDTKFFLSTVKCNGVLYEQVLQGEDYKFISYQNNQFVFDNYIKDNKTGFDYYPCVDEEVLKGAVKFCNGISEYASNQELLIDIERFLYRWLDIEDSDRMLFSYYVLQTWLFDCFETIGYARALGTLGVGKTRFLDAIGGICYKPITTTGALNVAPIFRILDKHQGTFVMDEADLDKSDETVAIMKILNSGWSYGKPVLRCNPNDVNEIQTFRIYGPKVLATRGRYKDKALESRCYTVTLTKTEREDIPVQQGEAFEMEQDIIKNKLLAFRLKNYDVIKYDPTLQQRFIGADPRLVQKIISLASIFKDDEKALNNLIGYTMQAQKDLIEETRESMEGKIGLILLNILVTGLEYFDTIDEIVMSSKDIANIYNKDISVEKYQIGTPKVGLVLKTLGFKTNPERKRNISICEHIKNLNGESILPSQTRQLVTTPEMVRKTLKRLTFPGEEKYLELWGVVTSVTSTKGECQISVFSDGFDIKKSEKTKDPLSPLEPVTPVTPVTDEKKRKKTIKLSLHEKINAYYSNIWAGNNGPVDSISFTPFCMDCANHLKVPTTDIKPTAEKIFAITPKPEQDYTIVRTAEEAQQAAEALKGAGY